MGKPSSDEHLHEGRQLTRAKPKVQLSLATHDTSRSGYSRPSASSADCWYNTVHSLWNCYPVRGKFLKHTFVTYPISPITPHPQPQTSVDSLPCPFEFQVTIFTDGDHLLNERSPLSIHPWVSISNFTDLPIVLFAELCRKRTKNSPKMCLTCLKKRHCAVFEVCFTC